MAEGLSRWSRGNARLWTAIAESLLWHHGIPEQRARLFGLQMLAQCLGVDRNRVEDRFMRFSILMRRLIRGRSITHVARVSLAKGR